ncbi:MAG: cell division protein ZapA [Pseudomonadota bacterium]
MPDVTVTIGQKPFTVACADGEEAFLRTAADMLNQEATVLVEQIPGIPERQMLLMAGLMLADRTAAFEERATAAETQLAKQAALISELESAHSQWGGTETDAASAEVAATLDRLAERVERLADEAETALSQA